METRRDQQRDQPKDETTTDDPYHDLRTIRLLSLILIALGLFFTIYMTLFIFRYYGRPRGLTEMLFQIIPYLYLISFFLCCLRRIRSRLLIALCVIFNLPLGIFIVYSIFNLSFAGIILSIFPAMWILLCRERLKLERAAPPDNRLPPTPR
jgi:hypothetical protein